MIRKGLLFSFVFILTFAFTSFAQEAAQTESVVAEAQAEVPAVEAVERVIRGTVKEIAEDGTYILVDDAKIMTTKEFLQDSFLEVGDSVEIKAEEAPEGLRAVSYDYVIEEETVMEEKAPEAAAQ